MSQWPVSAGCCSALAVLVWGAGSAFGVDKAAEGPLPPSGWEEPPPLLSLAKASKSPNTKKPDAPACCKFDSTCCSRQSTIDGFRPQHVVQLFETKFSDLPQATIKESKKDEPPFSGVPSPKIFDDGGRAFPWPDEPKGYLIHIVPPGRYGMIKLADEWYSGYFEQTEFRGHGAGAIRTIQEGSKDHGKGLLYVPIDFLSLAMGEGDKITYDEVKGKLEGGPFVKATYWMHTDCVNVGAGLVYGCRAPFEGEMRVAFALPEVILGFDSKDTKHVGGFFRSRFSSTVPLTMYYLPFGPGRSGLMNALMTEGGIRRWFPLPKGTVLPLGKGPNPESFTVVLATSQTSVEPETRVRVFLMDE